jgi:carboxyl-terminal processing protease
VRLNRKAIVGISVLCLLAVASIFVMAGDREERQQETVYRNIERFGAVLDKILNYYVDEIDADKLIKAAVDGMLRTLDEHSVYMDSYDYDNLMIDTRGEFGGLGFTVGTADGFPTVVSILDDTPAYRHGIQGGDKIVEIEGVTTKGLKTEEAVSKLRGRAGTQVNITVAREGLPDSLHFSVTREIIRVPSISYSTKLDDIGYIRVARFGERTARELDDAMRALERQKIKGLIIDLRGNPGGLLEAAREVSEMFLEKDRLIVYTESRIPSHNVKYYSRAAKVHDGYPVVILVSGFSASASEIVAGALQDWDRALIVGQTSYGKGSVQTVFTVGRDALKLTTAKYFTPSGRCIHTDRSTEDGEAAIALDGETPAPPAERPAEQPKDAPQERREYKTAAGRVVYGGGGITPDWEIVPQRFTPFQRDLELRNLFFNFAVNFASTHETNDRFEVTGEVLDAFKRYIADHKFAAPDSLWTPENTDYAKLAIRREVFRRLMGTKGAYIATLSHDEEVQRILEMFRAAPTLQQMFAYVQERTKTAEATAR